MRRHVSTTGWPSLGGWRSRRGLVETSSGDELKILRDEINKVTAEIIRLCAIRLSLAAKIGEIKLGDGLPIEISRVEEELRQTVIHNCRLHGINSQFGLRILNLLLEESKRLQGNLMK